MHKNVNMQNSLFTIGSRMLKVSKICLILCSLFGKRYGVRCYTIMISCCILGKGNYIKRSRIGKLINRLYRGF